MPDTFHLRARLKIYRSSRYVDARGRQRQFKIGAAHVLSVEQARRKGRSVLAEALLGADPQARRQELRATPTRPPASSASWF
jgi:hypothetical protein